MTMLFWRGNQTASQRTLEALRPNSTVWPAARRLRLRGKQGELKTERLVEKVEKFDDGFEGIW